MTEKKLIPFFSLIFFLFFASYSFAAEVLFQWGASSGVVEGYRIYYGFSHEGPYPNLLDQVGGTTTKHPAILDEGEEYYLVVRAYNDYGESDNSNEVKWPSDEPDSTPPRDITNAIIVGFDGHTLELGWTNPSRYDEYGEPIPENQDFQGVMIRYNTGDDAPYPANYTEGTLFKDEYGNLDEKDSCMGTVDGRGKTYKFSFFTHDDKGHYSHTVHLSVDTMLPPPPVNVSPIIDSFTGMPASLNNPGGSYHP